MNNLDPLTALSRDFTADEQSKIAAMMEKQADMPQTKEALDEFIGIILEEKLKPTESDIRNSSDEEFADMLSRLKEKRQ